MDARAIIDLIEETSSATLEQLATVLGSSEDEYLFERADKIRRQYFGDEVHLRGIIEFSNYCRCGCLYCGLQVQNSSIERYRMEPDEIIENARQAYGVGYRSLVLQSGEDPYYTTDTISYIIKEIKKIGDMAITLSAGERDYREYAQWKTDGADRYLLKHETANEEIYNRLHPHSSFKTRLQCLKWLKELGYQTGSGFMIGLPGQTLHTIANDILLLKELDVEMAGIGPFIPHPCTELRDEPTGSSLLTLKAVALTRILLKRPHLPTTTALEVSTGKNAFSAGANVIMRKIEPHKYRRLYDIYPKPLKNEKSLFEERRDVESYIESFGRYVSDTRGDALEYKA